MKFLSNIVTPYFLLFLIVIIGIAIGEIKFKSISFNISGVIIIAMLFGLFLSVYYPDLFTDEFINAFSCFSKLGSKLFIAVIGITSGFNINIKSFRKYFVFLLCGIFMVIAGFITAFIIGKVDNSIETSLLFGILCGALTSTPGLAALNEIGFPNLELIGIGYGTAYLFGVAGAIIYIQIVMKKYTSNNIPKNNVRFFNNNCKYSLLIISIVIIIGAVVGNIKVPIINITLGITGGILLTGIIFGAIISNYKGLSEKTFTDFPVYRKIGLILFFAGNGVISGKNLNVAFKAKWLVYGVLITVITLIVGDLLSRIFIKKNIMLRLYMIAGGITSTPALSVVADKANCDISAYSLAYLGALLTVVFGIRIVNIFF